MQTSSRSPEELRPLTIQNEDKFKVTRRPKTIVNSECRQVQGHQKNLDHCQFRMQTSSRSPEELRPLSIQNADKFKVKIFSR